MKNIAYKTISGSPNLPDGFIIEHFETDQDAVEGYKVVSKAAFDFLLKSNIDLMRAHEGKKGIESAHPNLPPVPQRSNNVAEPADPAIVAKIKEDITGRQAAVKQDQADAELFKQFLEWKRSQQGSGS